MIRHEIANTHTTIFAVCPLSLDLRSVAISLAVARLRAPRPWSIERASFPLPKTKSTIRSLVEVTFDSASGKQL